MNRRELLGSVLFGFLPTKVEPSKQVYIYSSKRDGRFKLGKEKTCHCIFSYRKGQNINEIEDVKVEVFQSKESLDRFLTTLEGKDFTKKAKEKNITLVIREITIYN